MQARVLDLEACGRLYVGNVSPTIQRVDVTGLLPID
jgi:hypothetical protein